MAKFLPMAALSAHHTSARKIVLSVDQNLETLETGRDTSLGLQTEISQQLNMLARSGPSGLLNLTIAGKGNVLLSSSAAMLAQTRTMGTAWEQFGSDSCITASVLPGLNDGPEVGLLASRASKAARASVRPSSRRCACLSNAAWRV